jgi:serine/threonine-protein kinase NIM1
LFFFDYIEKVAIKILDKTKLDERTQRLLLREITSMERLHHPNIIRLYEVIEIPNEIYIVTEYAPGGELYTRLSKQGKFVEDEAKNIFAQITAAVDHIVKYMNYLVLILCVYFSILMVLFIVI